MKQYQLLKNYIGFKAGSIFVGPLPIKAQSALGYYLKGTEDTAPSDQCIFASAVENPDNSSIFKAVTDEKA